MRSIVFRARLVACLFGFLALAAPQRAAAETLSLMWDPSPDSSISGYVVYVGTQSGVYANAYDVGRTTSFAWDGALNGQQYYFAVAAYWPGPIVGRKSAEITRFPNNPPVLANPGAQSGTVGSSASLQLTGSDPDGNPLVYGATGLPAGLQVTSSGRISGTLSTAGAFTVTATLTDGTLSDAETFTWTVAQLNSDPGAPPPASISGPEVSITIPTTDGSYVTPQTFVTLGGTARATGWVKSVEWLTDRGRSGSATGTENWIAGVPLQRGPNTITIRARDDQGNISTKAIVVKSTGGKAK